MAFTSASEAYFQDAINRHKKGGNAAQLFASYQEATRGLDKDLAFKALSGGRVFGDSDKQRYQDLLSRSRETSQPATQVVQAAQKSNNPTQPVAQIVQAAEKSNNPGASAGNEADARVDMETFQGLLNKLEGSKKRQQRQKSVEGRRDIYASGMAGMMSNF